MDFREAHIFDDENRDRLATAQAAGNPEQKASAVNYLKDLILG